MSADMTTQDDLAAGRELDKRVAEAIGWTFAHTEDEYDPRTPGSLTLVGVTPDKHRLSVVPAYSTDISAVEAILAHWRSKDLEFQMGYDGGRDGTLGRDYGPAGYWCQVFDSYDSEYATVRGCESLALAICKAAIMASNADQ